MINDQIKKEISDQLDKKLMQNSIEKIILNSQHHVLMFAGRATTVVSNITARFDNSLIQNKRMLIKRIQVIPYADEDTIDVLFSDGTSETAPANMRLVRTLETYGNSLNIRLLVNGAPLPIFSDDPVGGTYWYPLDLDCDNIYYLYKDPIDNLVVNAATQIFTDFTANLSDCLITVLIECYTF